MGDAVDMFLKISDVEQEATYYAYKEEIDFLS
jgi:hypothetical protein